MSRLLLATATLACAAFMSVAHAQKPGRPDQNQPVGEQNCPKGPDGKCTPPAAKGTPAPQGGGASNSGNAGKPGSGGNSGSTVRKP
jgi:hypothetical protein